MSKRGSDAVFQQQDVKRGLGVKAVEIARKMLFFEKETVLLTPCK